MKPFNLEQALAGAKVVTRDGRDVKIAGYNPCCNNSFNLLGWVGPVGLSWDSNGIYNGNPDNPSRNDLFMAPTERTEWVVRITYNDSKTSIHGPYESLERAKKFERVAEGETITIHEIKIIE